MKTTAPPADSGENPGLVFDWRRPATRRARLFLWLMVTLVCVVAFFALFRVVYPQSSRFIPNAQQVTLINSASPAGRALLAAVQDRDFMILAADEPKGGAVLADSAPVFHPSFEKHDLRLQDLPQRNSKPEPLRLMDVTEPVLPPLDLSGLLPEPPPGAKDQPVPVLTLEGGLARRAVLAEPDLKGLAGADLDGLRFHLGVDATGKVIFVLPVSFPGKAEETEPVLRLLSKLRLAPGGGGSPAWGFATLQWRKAPAP